MEDQRIKHQQLGQGQERFRSISKNISTGFGMNFSNKKSKMMKEQKQCDSI